MKKTSFDREAWIARRLWNRIHVENTNALVGVFGLPGTGKTYTAVRLAELIDPSFTLDRIVFTVPDLLHLINGPPRLPRGSAILFDDTSRGANSRKWQTPVNQALSDVGNTFRYEGYLVLCTARVSGNIDSQFRELFHLTLEIKNRDRAMQIIKAKPMIPSMDTARGKTYWHYPRALVPGRGYCRLKRVAFHRSTFQTGPHLTWTEYEHKKAAFMRAHYRTLERELRLDERMGGVKPWARESILLLKEQGLSYRKIAKRIGISEQAISQIVRRSPSVVIEVETAG